MRGVKHRKCDENEYIFSTKQVQKQIYPYKGISKIVQT